MGEVIEREIDGYDADRQREFARLAIDWYDWRRRGQELAEKIEAMRSSY
jgi:hypothetical protein